MGNCRLAVITVGYLSGRFGDDPNGVVLCCTLKDRVRGRLIIRNHAAPICRCDTPKGYRNPCQKR